MVASAGRFQHIGRNVFVSLAAPVFLHLSTVSAWSQLTCKPLLSFRGVEKRAVSMQISPWKWSATIAANTAHCATQSGIFEIDFVRTKENAPDLQFTEKFRWQAEEFRISMELNPDESILEFRIGFIAPCVCRPLAELSASQQR
jgi:hypothetical protein